MSAFDGVLFLVLVMAGSALAGYVVGRRHGRQAGHTRRADDAPQAGPGFSAR